MESKVDVGEAQYQENIDMDQTPNTYRVATGDINNYHGLTVKVVLVYASICLIGLAQLMTLVAAGAFARDIAAALGGSTESVWLPQAIAIITVVLGPPVSEGADLWGRKWFLVVLTSCGIVGSIIISRSTSMGMAIAGNVICGMAFGVQPLLYAVISEILPRRFRPAAQGGMNAALAVGGIIALLAGSVMVKDYSFRVFYYFLAALLAVSTITCAILYNPPPRQLQKDLSNSDKFRQLDWAAYALLTIGIVLFCIGLSWADNPYSWRSTHTLLPLLIGLAVTAILIFYQAKIKKNGLFHHDLFRTNRNFALAILIIFIDGMAFYAANNYFGFEISILFESDPVRANLRFCIVFFASTVSSILVALYSSWTKDVRLPIICSFALFVVFFACMTTITTGSSTAAWIYPILLGLGLGLSLTCLVTIAQLSTPPALIAITSGLIISLRSLGASVGLAIYTSIFNSALSQNLGKDIAAAVLPLGLSPENLSQFIGALASDDQQALIMVPGVTPQIIGAGVHALREAYLKSFKRVWIAAAALSGVATIAACFFVEPKSVTMHVDAPLDQEEDI